uniref:FLYWCH-type domain-containing protein n=1 Tax=Ditylenchus dipsaci TaxID=166011 RepID=A0A915DDB7_9BILA
MEEVREQVNQLMAEQVNDQAIRGSDFEETRKDYNTCGYQFWKKNEYKEKVYWQCWKVKVDGCRARLHTKKTSGEVIKVVGTHSCTDHPLSFLYVKSANGSRRQQPPIMGIFNSVLNGVPEAVQAKMDKSAVRKVVQRKRKGINGKPETPNGINFAIPGAYKKYRFGLNDEEPFLPETR